MSVVNIQDRSRLRGVSWKCHASFIGRSDYPPDKSLAQFLPLDRIARLPTAAQRMRLQAQHATIGMVKGGIACVLVACRVTRVDPDLRLVEVDVRVMTPAWHDDVRKLVSRILLPVIEECFVQTAERQLPPIDGTEVEIAAYYASGIEETPEEFLKSLGIMVAPRFEYLAGERRRAEREAARARNRSAADDRSTSSLSRIGASLADWFRRIVDAVLPREISYAATQSASVIADLWSEKSEEICRIFYGKAGQAAGQLLRHVTVHDAFVMQYLSAHQGVVVGESLTMQPQVTRAEDSPFASSRSFVFEFVSDADAFDSTDRRHRRNKDEE